MRNDLIARPRAGAEAMMADAEANLGRSPRVGTERILEVHLAALRACRGLAQHPWRTPRPDPSAAGSRAVR